MEIQMFSTNQLLKQIHIYHMYQIQTDCRPLLFQANYSYNRRTSHHLSRIYTAISRFHLTVCVCECSLISHGWRQNVVRTSNTINVTRLWLVAYFWEVRYEPQVSNITSVLTKLWRPRRVIRLHTHWRMELFITFFYSWLHSSVRTLIANSSKPIKTRDLHRLLYKVNCKLSYVTNGRALRLKHCRYGN